MKAGELRAHGGYSTFYSQIFVRPLRRRSANLKVMFVVAVMLLPRLSTGEPVNSFGCAKCPELSVEAATAMAQIIIDHSKYLLACCGYRVIRSCCGVGGSVGGSNDGSSVCACVCKLSFTMNGGRRRRGDRGEHHAISTERVRASIAQAGSKMDISYYIYRTSLGHTHSRVHITPMRAHRASTSRPSISGG